MRRAGLDASIDSNTSMLIKLAQALRLSDALPPESGRNLERMAKAVRLFAEARESSAAVNVPDQMLELLPEADAELAEARAAVERGTRRVAAALGFVGLAEARQAAALHIPAQVA